MKAREIRRNTSTYRVRYVQRGICGTGVRAREIRGNTRRVRYTERDMWYRDESQGNKREH